MAVVGEGKMNRSIVVCILLIACAVSLKSDIDPQNKKIKKSEVYIILQSAK